MSQTKRKHVPNSGKKTQWPNLPHQLLDLLARKPNLMENITSFGCVIKSWRSPSKYCTPNDNMNPQLVEIHRNKEGTELKKNPRSHVIEIPFHDGCFWYKKERVQDKWYQGMYFKGYSHGKLIFLRTNSTDCYLWGPAGTWHTIPFWDKNLPLKLATLSSYLPEWRWRWTTQSHGTCRLVYSPPDVRFPCIVMAITGISRPAFAFYRGGTKWILEDCKVKDPYSNPLRNMEFCNTIGFQGKFYALSLQGCLAVIEEDIDGSCFRIASLGRNRAVTSKSSRQFREYLMECDGEILLVFLVSRKTIDVVDDVEVFRLNFDRLLWMKVESLAGRTLFLEDECCMWIRSSEIGCRSACIYFTHHRVQKNEWFLYDLGTGCISSPCMKWDEPMEEEYS